MDYPASSSVGAVIVAGGNMGNEHQTSGIGVRDVRQAYDALYEDLGMAARVVVFVRRDAAAPNTLSIVAQVVDAQGRPVEGIQAARQGWPNNQFKTLTAALHWCVWQLYQYADTAVGAVGAGDAGGGK